MDDPDQPKRKAYLATVNLGHLGHSVRLKRVLGQIQSIYIVGQHQPEALMKQ